MSERETRDFMSVDSFSQLPFIRPSPKPSNSPTSSSAAIRLFGFEFPPDPPSKELADTITASSSITTANTATGAGSSGGSETGRKFECHYCCRNFPTSQALGGHQNAHKRERQHAKRVHLQSAMAAAHAHHNHVPITEGHVYSILNYHGLGSGPTAQHHHVAARFGMGPPTGPPPHYPSWCASAGGGPRFYGGLGSVSQPINGSPLPGFWRVPNGTTGIMTHRDNLMALPLLGGDLEAKPITVGSSSSSSSPSSSASHAQDHSVSLDLHL